MFLKIIYQHFINRLKIRLSLHMNKQHRIIAFTKINLI